MPKLNEVTPDMWSKAAEKYYASRPVPQNQYLGLDWSKRTAPKTSEFDWETRSFPKEDVEQYVKTYGHSDYKEVEHPNHYVEGRKYEPWDVIEDWNLNYFAATALKYISRYERKGEPIRDLKKAIEFLKREIARLERKT